MRSGLRGDQVERRLAAVVDVLGDAVAVADQLHVGIVLLEIGDRPHRPRRCAAARSASRRRRRTRPCRPSLLGQQLRMRLAEALRRGQLEVPVDVLGPGHSCVMTMMPASRAFCSTGSSTAWRRSARRRSRRRPWRSDPRWRAPAAPGRRWSGRSSRHRRRALRPCFLMPASIALNHGMPPILTTTPMSCAEATPDTPVAMAIALANARSFFILPPSGVCPHRSLAAIRARVPNDRYRIRIAQATVSGRQAAHASIAATLAHRRARSSPTVCREPFHRD